MPAGALVIAPWVSRSARAARRRKALNGGKDPAAKRSSAMRESFRGRSHINLSTSLICLSRCSCGLRYARSRAKKEGTSLPSHRKRKDKGLSVTTKRESATPSPINGSYSGSRRNGHDEISLSGSASGSEVHSHSGHAAMEGVTPSPSPPASNTSFVHYAHPNGAHQRNSQIHPSSSYPNTNSFYSVPSPLSNSNVHQSSHSNHNSPMSAMRMDSSYPRVPTSTSAPASYERERDEERELPPTPVSPESRLSSARSILMLQQ
jgi:hypothetical protein